MMHGNTPIRMALFGTLVSLLGLTACEHESSAIAEHKSKLVVSHPLVRDVAIGRDFVGQIHSNRHIEVRAIEPGYLQEVAVNEGQRVEKGQLMFRVLPLTYTAELQSARAEADVARLEYENTKLLADSDVVSASELALAKAAYEKAKAEVSLAEAHLGFTEIRAPFSGIMDRLHVREGSLLEEGEFLTTLFDNSVLWVYFNVPEADYLDYMASSRNDTPETVALRMANGELFPHAGEIAVIEAEFNNETGTIPFRADFPNPDGLLRHGQTGNVALTTPFANALLAPQKATFEVLDHTYVYVVDAEHRVSQRRIEIGEEIEDMFIVVGGLREDDMIVVEGLRHVRDGQTIEFEYAEPAQVLASLKLPAE